LKISKTKVPLDDDVFALYINILNFKNEKEWMDTYKAVKAVLKKHKD